MIGTPVRGLPSWAWRPLSDSGLLHLAPPQPGPLATTACGKPLTDEARQAGLWSTDGQRCSRCQTRLREAGG